MNSPISILQAIVYGIVQGITEWLPISSTAHLRIVPALLGWQDPGSAFTAVIQLGTILAVLIYFAKDLKAAISAWFGSLRGKGKDTPEAKIGWGVFYGTIPILGLGFLFKDEIKGDSMRSLYVISGTLIVMGVLMLISEKVGSQKRRMEDVTVKDGVVVGLFQALALIPGMSRSGSTITGGLFIGLDRATAARFSFLLSVPSIVAAGLYELFDERKNIMGPNLVPILVSTFVSFVVGYASIAWLMKFISRSGVTVFVVYRIVLGLALLGLISSGKLTASEPTASEGKPSVSQASR